MVVEVKTAGEYSRKFWNNGVPNYVYWQVVHQLIVTGLKKALVLVSIGGKAPEKHVIEPPEEHMDLLTDTWIEFWDDVDNGRDPDVGWATNPAKLVSDDDDEESEGDFGVHVLYRNFLQAKTYRDMFERDYKTARNRLIQSMETKIVLIPGIRLKVQVRANGSAYLYDSQRKDDK